ncbi:MAG: hypothetical protein MHM6MM_003909 [Cercozoa sp. M6MM]
MTSVEEQRRLVAEYLDTELYAAVDESGPGSLLTFNVNHGFLDGLMRGFKSAFLKAQDYRQLAQCETLEDARLFLGDTDYADAMRKLDQSEEEDGHHVLTPDAIVNAVRGKFHEEFELLRTQSRGALRTFLNMIQAEYMIANVCFLVMSVVRGTDPEKALAALNPIGYFPALRRILAFDSREDTLNELYATVLIDTPVAKYFEAYFRSQSDSASDSVVNMRAAFNEEDISYITQMLQKLWLEDFYRHCSETLSGESREVMRMLLEFEADKRALNIMVNSFDTPLNSDFKRDSDRKALFCNFGRLYPEAIQQFSAVSDRQQLANVLRQYPLHYALWQRAEAEDKDIEDALFEQEVAFNRHGFDGQSHLASFWSFVRLREQEKRNIFWIVECIHQNMRDANTINRWIQIF